MSKLRATILLNAITAKFGEKIINELIEKGIINGDRFYTEKTTPEL